MATPVEVDLSSENPFTPSQWKVLLAIADTFIPSLTDAEVETVKAELLEKLPNPDFEKIDPYLRMSAVDSPRFVQYLQYFMAKYVDTKPRNDLAGVLDMMNGGAMTFVFTGTTTPFPDLPRPDREEVLRKWHTAYIPIFRTLYEAFAAIIFNTFLKASPESNRAMDWEEPSISANIEQELPNPHLPVPQFENDQLHAEQTLTTDVVIVGSGSGGAAIAATLAKAGFKVVVVEKATYVARENFPLPELEAHEKLFESGTVITSDDGHGHIITGSTWGGGTTVNWMMSFQVSRLARREWVEKHGLPFAESQEFQDCMDQVCERLGVAAGLTELDLPNQACQEGAKKLGWNTTPVPRNCAGKSHPCGGCGHGCRSGGKQGCAVTWLPDAQAAGAKFIHGCEVEKIIIENGTARGITAKVDGKPLTINANRVVVSAGSMQSPCLLLRSGVKNPNIGKNLKVHPGTAVIGFFNGREMKAWEGGTITTMINDINNLDGNGYGTKVFPVWCYPSFSLSGVPWETPAQWRALTLRYRSAVSFGIQARERDSSGIVAPDPVTGKPRVTSYNLAAFDRSTITEGVVTACELLVAAGADELYPVTVQNPPAYIVDKKNPINGGGVSDPRFKEFVARIRKDGFGPQWFGLHQMGTCRMGASEETSVVDSLGRVWGVKGLYVADASIFPSCPGSNPMVPSMAFGLWVGKHIIAEEK